MTLTFLLVLDYAICPRKMSLSSKVIIWTQRHTQTPNCYMWATKVMINPHSNEPQNGLSTLKYLVYGTFLVYKSNVLCTVHAARIGTHTPSWRAYTTNRV